MILTPNQSRYLKLQVSLWSGFFLDADIPEDYAYLLLGLPEANLMAYDCRGNKDFQHNPLFWSGSIMEPVINQWLMEEIIRYRDKNENLNSWPPWPQGKLFAVCLTHDVDLVTPNSLPALARYLGNKMRIMQRGREKLKSSFFDLGKLIVCTANSLRNRGHKDFFDPWLELEDSFGFRSTFFFFPDQASKYHLRDGPFYRHHDKLKFEGRWITVQEFMRILETKGWEVGLHGTFESFDDSREIKMQKEQIESSLGSRIVSVRQHNLHFDITKTPQAHAQAGFEFDSTYGFNRLIGFRNGLALPFYHFDLKTDQPLPILQIPLHIQDIALLRNDNLDMAPELALRHSKELIDKVEKTRGLVTLSWHPNVYDGQTSGWFWVYKELLKYLAHKEPWVAPVREIGIWWKKRQKMLKQ